MANKVDELNEKIDQLHVGYCDLVDELVRLGFRSAQDADAMKAKHNDHLTDIKTDYESYLSDENEETNESNS